MLNLGMVSGIVLLFYSLVMLIQSVSYGYMQDGLPSAGFFPLWINLILAVASVLYIIESIRKDVVRVDDVMPDKLGQKKIISLIIGLLFFCLTAKILGFFVSGVVLLFLMFMWDFKWPKAAILSFIFMGIVYVIFQFLLKVSLPTNFLGF